MLARTLERFREGHPDARVVTINLLNFDRTEFASLHALTRGIVRRVLRALERPMSAPWDDTLPAATCATEYVEDHVLRGSESPLLVALDAADAVQRAPFREDFFTLLRSWAEMQNRAWGPLRLLLAISTRPARLIEEPHRSPFNLSPPIVLGDLGAFDVEALARRYGISLSTHERERLMDEVGGHPYLVRAAFHALATGVSLDALLDARRPVREVFNGALAWLANWIDQHPGHRALLARIARSTAGERHVGPEARDLEALGLLKESEDDTWRLRCKLYRRLTP